MNTELIISLDARIARIEANQDASFSNLKRIEKKLDALLLVARYHDLGDIIDEELGTTYDESPEQRAEHADIALLCPSCKEPVTIEGGWARCRPCGAILVDSLEAEHADHLRDLKEDR